MTRVLHVITGLGLGGAEHQLVQLARYLPVQCEVAVLTGPPLLAGELRAIGVPVHDLNMAHNRDLTVLPRLVALIRRGRYDAVHTHLYRACLYGRVAARLAGVRRIIATEHSLGENHMEGRSTTWPVRITYRACERLGTATIAVSPTVERRLRDWGVPARKLVTIPNGLDPAVFAFSPEAREQVRGEFGLGPGDFVVGTVGRLVPTKQVDVLIEAIAALPGARLLIVGDGPDASHLQATASASPASGRVVFAGAREDIGACLSAMDVFASPSAQETFGLSVLEALANGLPTLYTTCPALDDLAGCPAPGDPPIQRVPGTAAAYTTALAALGDRPVSPRSCAAAARAYAVDGLVTRLVALYQGGQSGLMTTCEEAHP